MPEAPQTKPPLSAESAELAARVEVQGSCDPRFEAVREALRANFREADDREWGASVCAFVGPHRVVDLWAGFTDAEARSAWAEHTLVNAYSVGKGVLAMLALACVESGEIDLDCRVADYWPEFEAYGKDALSVRDMLAHRTGLPGVRRILHPLAMYDWALICAELADQTPFWAPGEHHGYHVNTQGHLVGEVLRRATGRSIGALLRERLCGPLDVDFYWGLPNALHAHVSRVFAPDLMLTEERQWALAFPPTGDAEHDLMIWRTYFNPAGFSGIGTVNTSAWRRAAIPSTNGHGHARGVATLYRAYLSGKVAGRTLVGEGLRAEACAAHSDGDDRVLGRPSRFGLGFQLPQPGRSMGPSASAFGHYGYGGSIGMADPAADMAFAFITNRPGRRWQPPRTNRLLDALYGAL